MSCVSVFLHDLYEGVNVASGIAISALLVSIWGTFSLGCWRGQLQFHFR